MHNTANIRPRLSADLKVGTTDVPGAYAKLLDEIAKVKGQVRDGKLNEQDKVNIHAMLDFNVPTADKAAIDKLLEAIGPTLERVNIQAPISELSTPSKFGYTLLLRNFASIPPRQGLVEIVATLDVAGAYAKIQDAIAKAKGQIADAKLNEQEKNNVNAHLEFTVPSDEQKQLEKLLESLGTVLSRTNVQAPTNQLATAKKFGFSLTLRNFASIPPSKATDLKVATSDVPASYAKLQEAIAQGQGASRGRPAQRARQIQHHRPARFQRADRREGDHRQTLERTGHGPVAQQCASSAESTGDAEEVRLLDRVA